MNSILVTPKSQKEYSRVMKVLKTMDVYTMELENDEKDLKPMSLEEFYAMIDQSEKDFEEGRVISQEDLEKEIKGWH